MLVNKKDSHDNWATPKEHYDTWNQEFNFDFDPCPLFSTFDGLSIEWGQRNFVNPPFCRPLKDNLSLKLRREQKG